jgi:hypothetical protein
MRRPELGGESSRSKSFSEMQKTARKAQSENLVVCIDNEGYPASLELRKIYVALSDPTAAKHRMLRIVDESGEDYLYPKAFLREITLPAPLKKAVLAAA